MGARRFGLHTMLVSNELSYAYMVESAAMLLEVVEWVSEALSIDFDFINLGGGLGIPYQPEQEPLDIDSMADEIGPVFFLISNNETALCRGSISKAGDLMTGPHGISGQYRHQSERYLSQIYRGGCLYVRLNAAGHLRCLPSHYRHRQSSKEAAEGAKGFIRLRLNTLQPVAEIKGKANRVEAR